MTFFSQEHPSLVAVLQEWHKLEVALAFRCISELTVMTVALTLGDCMGVTVEIMVLAYWSCRCEAPFSSTKRYKI